VNDARDPFKLTGRTALSFSGGRTSAYMLWRVLQSNGLPPADELQVVFANTGKEDEATLRFVKRCADEWGVPITWVEFRTDEAGYAVVDFDRASRHGEPFEALIRKKHYLPNPVERFCTQMLKVEPIRARSGLDDDDTMVGVRADSSARTPRMRARGLLLPLVDAGVTKATVRAFWRCHAFDLELAEHDGVTPDGNCDLCFMKTGAQVLSSIAKAPAKAVWWLRQEQERGATFRFDRPSYAQMARFAAEQRDFFGHDDEEAIPCFCGD